MHHRALPAPARSSTQLRHSGRPIGMQITEEQHLRADLEHRVEALRQRIAEQRVAMGGMNASAEQSLKVPQRRGGVHAGTCALEQSARDVARPIACHPACPAVGLPAQVTAPLPSCCPLVLRWCIRTLGPSSGLVFAILTALHWHCCCSWSGPLESWQAQGLHVARPAAHVCSGPALPHPCCMQVQRRIRVLEDRLQQCTVRHNQGLTRSARLRARIDSLRRERLLFEELAGKLGRGLERRKEEMVGVIARIAEAHEAREKVGCGRVTADNGRRGDACNGCGRKQSGGRGRAARAELRVKRWTCRLLCCA